MEGVCSIKTLLSALYGDENHRKREFGFAVRVKMPIFARLKLMNELTDFMDNRQNRLFKGLVYALFLLMIGSADALARRAKGPRVSVDGLRVENLTNPLGIDALSPRFSWRIVSDERDVMQQSYHILVASSPEKLAEGKGDLWDSQVV